MKMFTKDLEVVTASSYLTMLYNKTGAHYRSFHLPYLPSELTLSRIFLFLEAPPTGFFAGVYIITNHKRAVVLYCLCHMQAARKYFNNGEKRGKIYHFFKGAVQMSASFHGKLKNPTRISVLKIKRYETGLTQGYNWYGGSR